MLVLTRKFQERILIGNNIRITITHIQEGRVRIGIEAPKSLPIYREEIAPFEFALPDGASPEEDDASDLRW